MTEYVRVITNLPNNRETAEVKAFRAFISHIQAHEAVGGYSQIDRVDGYWIGESKEWVRDRITLIITDLKAQPTIGNQPVNDIIASFKQFAHQTYEQYGCKQEDFWITSSPIIVH